MKNGKDLEFTVSGKKMSFQANDFPEISKMLSWDNIPSAPLMSCAQLQKQRINNEGGKFDFKNSSAKDFFLADKFF